MTETNAVAIKLPTFWAQQPEVWFLQAEAQFHIRKITDGTTKYYHVVAALDQETSGRVLDTLSAPPANNKYTNLKQRLLTTYGLTKRERASKLLHLHPLGDRKPSELMDEMLSLLADHGFCFLAEQLFLEQLPDDIRLQLSNDDFTHPRALATKADVLWIAKQQAATTINNVTSQPKGQITTTHDTQQKHWCFYHKRFGDNANNCKPPCNHPAAPTIATVTTCRAKRAQARLLYVKDDISGLRFLVDSGAFVSVFPASGIDTRSHRPSALLEAVNGSKIRTYGHKQITLSIDGRKYVWQFLVADVTQPLLGADFLCSNTLMVDVKGQRLVDPTTYTSSSAAEESLTPVATELADFNITSLSNNLEILKQTNSSDNSFDMDIKNLTGLPLPVDLDNHLNKAPGAVPSMASGAPLLPGASAAQSMYPSTQHKSQNQPPQHDVYAQYNIPSNTANVTAAAYAHQMAASAAGGTAPYASAAGPYSGISAASFPDLYTGFPDYGLLSTTTGQLQHSLTAISACNLPPAQPASMHDPFIPGAICNQTLEQLTESAQPVIRECPPQHRNTVIAAQHQSLAAATSAATAEPRARRSPVTRRHHRQQQRHSESPESALPQAFQPPCSSSTLLSSPPSSTQSSLTSSSSSSSMHPALLAAATAGHHPMLLDVEQASHQYPAAAAMSSHRGATALPVCTGPHHDQHPACTGATHTSWSYVPLPAFSMQHIPARGLFPPGNPAALQLPPPPTPRPRGRPRKRP